MYARLRLLSEAAIYSATESASTPECSRWGVNTAPIAHASASTSSRPIVPGNCAERTISTETKKNGGKYEVRDASLVLGRPGEEGHSFKMH